MPTEQYHEPPEELAEDVRTFARMCTSLIEEAEAINWYAQRLAIERDSAAAAIMRDAQNEEFKHFSMDLEYLLRRSPRWRAAPASVPAPRARDRAAPHRQPPGARPMNHLLRELAPVSDAAWDEI